MKILKSKNGALRVEKSDMRVEKYNEITLIPNITMYLEFLNSEDITDIDKHTLGNIYEFIEDSIPEGGVYFSILSNYVAIQRSKKINIMEVNKTALIMSFKLNAIYRKMVAKFSSVCFGEFIPRIVTHTAHGKIIKVTNKILKDKGVHTYKV